MTSPLEQQGFYSFHIDGATEATTIWFPRPPHGKVASGSALAGEFPSPYRFKLKRIEILVLTGTTQAIQFYKRDATTKYWPDYITNSIYNTFFGPPAKLFEDLYLDDGLGIAITAQLDIRVDYIPLGPGPG